ncbi:MAG: ATP-binding cassette domain-containing protein [Lachnospiraceae bacterium]|nr:ATP-binding cassette domain-containing protein [Lachnospiraceae bacterium]
MNVIETENLSKTFRVKQKEKGIAGSMRAIFHPQIKEIPAVSRVSFSVEEGEALAFIGPNGAGKSTTIKMLTGILYPDGGRAEVLGMDPSRKRKQLACKIGTVFGQKEQLWTHLTPYDNFRFFGAIYDLSDKETESRIRELADIFDLNSFVNTPVRNLSLGQRIRCEIVASLIHRPRILFLDEPTIGLDPVVKENIRSLIRQMNKELHTTIFLTSHDIGDIEKLCKRIIIVNNGQIVLDNSMSHLKYNYLNRKILEVKQQEETAPPTAEGITVLKQKGNHIKLEVDTGVLRINDALRLINAEHVEDITISNIPLESIITEIYKTADAGI